MKLFHCTHCAQRVFFENTGCETCGSALGFVPAELNIVAFEVFNTDDSQRDASQPASWRRLGAAGPAQRPCDNYARESVCNWMVAADDPQGLCVSCRTTDVIPVLVKPENRKYWKHLEQAKRRLFYTLLALGLPVPGKSADAAHGLSFRFLEDVSPAERVLTGHDEGVITLNIAEADDALREKMRTAMHEPYRSLLGHFRHESGHYYWDRLVAGTPWQDAFRQLFGDETTDYAQALQQHYAGPVMDWHLHFISAYASAHPWEDWAECWAHYLHMVDGLETAAAWGLRLDRATPGEPPLQAFPLDPAAASVEPSLIQQWLPISQFSNSMNRSLGLHDSYPFVVPAPVVAKLNFIHRVVGAAARGEVAMNFSRPFEQNPVPALSPMPAVTGDGGNGMAPVASAGAVTSGFVAPADAGVPLAQA